MISMLIVLLSVACISSLTLAPLIFQCCKKKKGKKDKKQAKHPEVGGGAAAKDAAAKDAGAKVPSAEAVAHKKPEDKKKAPNKGDSKDVKPPVTYHVLKGKATSSELAKKATATAQVAPITTLQPSDAVNKTKQPDASTTGQKSSSDAAKKATRSKASVVKSNTNDDAQPSKSNTGVFDEANSTDNAAKTNSGIDGVEVPPTAITETSKREEGKPEIPGGEEADTQLYETVPGGGGAGEKKAVPQDEAGGSYETLDNLNIGEKK